jgi:hypothetical protein
MLHWRYMSARMFRIQSTKERNDDLLVAFQFMGRSHESR